VALAYDRGGAGDGAPRRVESSMNGFDTASFAVVTSPPARRTVQIRGRGAEGYAWSTSTSRRSAGGEGGRRGSSPDRMALWAVLLGVLLVLVAATSSHAATLRHGVAARPAAAPAHVRVLAGPRAPKP
jgi:hypothetical protein